MSTSKQHTFHSALLPIGVIADDRRAGLVEVTALGRRTHDRLRADRGRLLADALDRIDPHQRAALEAALPALEALVEATRTK